MRRLDIIIMCILNEKKYVLVEEIIQSYIYI